MRHRPRRLRATAAWRDAVAQTRLHAARLVQPHFVLPGEDDEQPIDALPGIARQSVDRLVDRVGADLDLGIASVLLFGLVDGKDERGSAALDPEGPVPSAVRALKQAFGSRLVVMTDVCLCGATSHGHCGVMKEGEVANDATLPLLAQVAGVHAAAGADAVAPSDMMDGRVAAIRDVLDAGGHQRTAIVAYSSKFASAFYGPFREAAGSAPKGGDRRGYQLDARDGRGALRESLLDEAEGADVLMVKPALAYLDVIAAVRARTLLPLAAYNVSGEYGMVKAAAARGWIDEGAAVTETLTAIARAGADLIITYHARDALQRGWLD